MTCNDCIHYEACKDIYYPMSTYDEEAKAFDESNSCDGCPFYSDASRFIELPCKVGDTIYFDTYRRGESIGIKPHKVAKVEVVVSTERPFGCVGAEIPDWQFGKTVFLTREEAEKALKERTKSGKRNVK